MTRNRLWYLVFFAACLIFSAAYQSRLSAVLLVAACLYPLLALLFTFFSLWTVRVSFGINRGVYEKNEQFELPVQVSNNFFFPFAPAELTCNIPDNDTGLFLRKQVFVSVSPFKKMRIFLPCMHKYRGCYPAQITRITVYDPLKIIRLSRKANSQMQLVILPRKISLAGFGGIFGSDKGAVPQPINNGEKEDFSHVREYKEGDILQMIHWKLTAKQQELMIKQYEADGDRRGVVLCDLRPSGSSSLMQLKQTDLAVEAAISAALSALESSVRVTVDFGSPIFGGCNVNDRAGFERFYDIASVVAPDYSAAELTELIHRYSVGGSSAMLIITPNVGEDIFNAAESAAERISGAVVLLYINCTGKKEYNADNLSDRKFIFAEINGDSDTAIEAAADSVFSDYNSQI